MTLRNVPAIDLDGFTVSPMTFEGVPRDVYRRGTGPGVIVMHEIPGITPDVARFGRMVTTDLVDREGHPTRIALDRVLSFFAENLSPGGRPAQGRRA